MSLKWGKYRKEVKSAVGISREEIKEVTGTIVMEELKGDWGGERGGWMRSWVEIISGIRVCKLLLAKGAARCYCRCQPSRRECSDWTISLRQGHGTADPGMSVVSAVPLHGCCGSLSLVSSTVWVDVGISAYIIVCLFLENPQVKMPGRTGCFQEIDTLYCTNLIIIIIAYIEFC